MFDAAVNYSRTSTPGQSKDKTFSADEQLKIGRSYASRLGGHIAYEYVENDSAFHDGLNRPELNKIRKLAANGMIDAIIFYDLSRFTRDVADGIILYREFSRLGVKLFSVTEGEVTDDNQLIFIFTNYQNQEWVRKNREKSMIGLRGKVESGIYPGGGRGAPYGYVIEGRRKQTKLVVLEERATLVRDIYRWYALEGYTVTEIADFLSERRTPSPGDILGYSKKREKGIWTPDTIKTLIRTEHYKGIAYFFKTKKVNGKAILRPRDEWVAIEIPAIVPVALWEMANDKMNRGKVESPRNKVHEYLAGGRVKCGICASMHVNSSVTGMKGYKDYTYYRCNSNRGDTATPRCGMPHVRGDMVDSAIWTWVLRLLEQPSVILQGYKDAQRQMQQDAVQIEDQLSTITTDINQYEGKLHRLLDAIEDGTLPRDMIRQRAEEYRSVLLDLKSRQLDLQSELESKTISDKDIQSLIGTLAQYRKMILADAIEADFQTRRAVIEALSLFFVLSIEDGTPVLYIRWLFNRFRIAMYASDATGGSNTEMDMSPRSRGG